MKVTKILLRDKIPFGETFKTGLCLGGEVAEIVDGMLHLEYEGQHTAMPSSSILSCIVVPEGEELEDGKRPVGRPRKS